MQSMVPLCLLCLVVLQQTINAASIFLFNQNPNNEIMRLPIARRLRAPLMGRSITTAKTTVDDGIHLIQNKSDGNSSSNEYEPIHLSKRRYGLALLGQPRWFTFKRRGPLFG